ncbi:hypothetical protein DFH09DRAFT_1096769 [Mycena vulgaris]|nr:hypothetical protein DFH09DRAFT_1096769 [Mycena vulgaris]
MRDWPILTGLWHAFSCLCSLSPIPSYSPFRAARWTYLPDENHHIEGPLAAGTVHLITRTNLPPRTGGAYSRAPVLLGGDEMAQEDEVLARALFQDVRFVPNNYAGFCGNWTRRGSCVEVGDESSA